MTESNAISKGPCDSCGSSDGNVSYDDGHAYCFVCETYTHGDAPMERVTLTSGDELARITAQWQAAKPAAIPERSLTSATATKYGVVTIGENQYYPYFSADKTAPVGFKVRHVPTKGFRVVGDVKEAGLFGQQRYGNHDRKRVVVTEGELDALAVSSLLDDKVAVVSLKGGAAAAGRNFKEAYSYLDGHDEIIVCFDADDAGMAGIEKVAEVFAGKLRIIRLDAKVGKDACDYLKAGLKKEFTDLYWSASTYTPKGILSKDELWDRLNSERPDKLGDYPWEKLNDLTFGFRPTELITVTAGSGLGKSSILRELVMHVKNTTDNRIGCLFMEESVERTAEGFMGVDLSTPVHLPTSAVKRGSDEYRESFDRVFGDEQLMIMDASFDTGASVDAVVARVRYMAKALDCKVIILDHISILVSGGQHGDERKALDEIMTKLRTLTQDTGIVLFAVSHLKRPEGKGHEEGAVTSVAQLRGSASIAQLSDFVIGLERNGQSEDQIERNTTHIRVLKNRFSGITGPAGHLLYDGNTGRLREYEPEDFDDAL
jgi:twinkle protein